MARRCGHCKQLKPDWTAVSVEVKEIFDEKEGDEDLGDGDDEIIVSDLKEMSCS